MVEILLMAVDMLLKVCTLVKTSEDGKKEIHGNWELKDDCKGAFDYKIVWAVAVDKEHQVVKEILRGILPTKPLIGAWAIRN